MLFGSAARLPEGEAGFGPVDLPAFGSAGARCALLAEVCQGQARTVGVVRCLTPLGCGGEGEGRRCKR